MANENVAEQSENKKVSMTDEERLKLCQKLDRELDEFINSLEKKRYSEGWSEDTWQEEMEKHPFFMKSTPDGTMSPLAEGLAKLKYDPLENTPVELANNYKEDGNFNFKYKNYRLAILSYTEGIRVKCKDNKINAVLYNNRAAANLQLKNYRSALLDCEKALHFDPEYTKCRLKAAKTAYQLKDYEKAIEHCMTILEQHRGENSEFTEGVRQLAYESKRKKTIKDRDNRRQFKQEAEKNAKIQEVIKAVKDRGIKIADHESDDREIDVEKIIPTFSGGYECMVYLEDGLLRWPVHLLYPEYQVTDLVKDFPENVTLKEQLDKVFGETAPWDVDKKYNCDTINVYYDGNDNELHVLKDIDRVLGEILKMEHFEVKSGTPTFYVLLRGSVAEKNFFETFAHMD